MNNNFDAIVVGAGAAGLFCAANLAAKGFKTLLVEHNNSVGKKIQISGGGRCNFTNINATSDNYISENPHFSKSALSQYTPWDFVSLVCEYEISYHEKHLGQLFCDNSSKDIINMLLDLCHKNNVDIICNSKVQDISKEQQLFNITINDNLYQCPNVVLATGGLSIPPLGATDFGHTVAKKFGHTIIPLKPGLVPLTSTPNPHSDLSGISLKAKISSNTKTFVEDILFTHKGLSGPGILQISSYLQKNEDLIIDLLAGIDIVDIIFQAKNKNLNPKIATFFKEYLPKKLVDHWFNQYQIKDDFIQSISDQNIQEISSNFTNWKYTVNGTEGYRKAEVTVGGVSTDQISSKSMESKLCKGLFFIGELLDVTGWLGGYNFQWAWASAYACSQHMEKFSPKN